MSKKLLVIILTLSMVFTLAACGNKDENTAILDNTSDVIHSGVDRPENNTNPNGSFAADDTTYPSKNPLDSADPGEVIIYDEVLDDTGETVRSPDAAGYGYNEDGLLVEIDKVTVTIEGADDKDVNGTYTYETPISGFTGVLVIDNANPDNENIQDVTDLLSGELYLGKVDIEVTKNKWEDILYNIELNPDQYNGKIIKLRGTSIKYGNYAKLHVEGSDEGFIYRSEVYPDNGADMILVGTIKKGIADADNYIDTIQLSYVLN